MSSALGLRAVLVPCARIDPQRPQLALAISYLDGLWSPRAGEWLHGDQAATVSTSADFHCASAILAIREAWRDFDPIEHVLKGRRRNLRDPGPGVLVPVEVRWRDGTLTVEGTTTRAS